MRPCIPYQPNGQKLPTTSWLWAYWPVRNVALDGQQSGKVVIVSVKLVPLIDQQPLHVGHQLDVGGGHVVGHHDEDVRAPLLLRTRRGGERRRRGRHHQRHRSNG